MFAPTSRSESQLKQERHKLETLTEALAEWDVPDGSPIPTVQEIGPEQLDVHFQLSCSKLETRMFELL